MNISRPSLPSSRIALLLGAAAGALNVFAFAPFGLWPLQILLLALLFWLVLRQESTRRAGLIGWGYSFGWLATGFHWLHISMHQYGGMPAWMSILAVLLLAAGLGTYAGMAMGLGHWLMRRWRANPVVTLLLILPPLWALADWLRGWLFTGFPWVGAGYAHSASPLAGYAALIGVYGIAWLGALVAGSLVLAIRRPVLVAPAAAILLAGIGLRTVEWTEAHGRPISVRMLQGNVPQDLKFQPEQIEAALHLYFDMMREKPADLIATPETALPLLLRQLPPDYLPRLQDFARASGSSMIIGIPINDSATEYANSVIGIGPTTAERPYRYDKHHLVPFGEFIPLGFRWFVNMMSIPLGDFTSGGLLQPPFQVKDQWVLPNICYEDLFGEEIAAQLAERMARGQPAATVLLNVSNIAWFGDSIALPQHLQISQMRSLETGRPMLRATNTGVTAVIDARGRVQAQLPAFQRGALDAEVQGHSGMTPYIRFGNMPAVALALLSVLGAWALGRRSSRDQSQAPLKTR